MKNLDAAISDYEIQQKAHPQSSVATLRIGAAYEAAGDVAKKAGNDEESKKHYLLAVESLQKCVDGNFVGNGPDEGNRFFRCQARVGLAKAYLKLDKPDQAIKTLSDLSTEGLPKELVGGIYFFRMKANEKLGNEAAAAELEKMLEEMGVFKKAGTSERSEAEHFPAEINKSKPKGIH